MEACHYDLNNEWESVKVEEKNPHYLPKLKDTVVQYNGKHIWTLNRNVVITLWRNFDSYTKN